MTISLLYPNHHINPVKSSFQAASNNFDIHGFRILYAANVLLSSDIWRPLGPDERLGLSWHKSHHCNNTQSSPCLPEYHHARPTIRPRHQFPHTQITRKGIWFTRWIWKPICYHFWWYVCKALHGHNEAAKSTWATLPRNTTWLHSQWHVSPMDGWCCQQARTPKGSLPWHGLFLFMCWREQHCIHPMRRLFQRQAFQLPGLPDEIELTRSKLSDWLRTRIGFDLFLNMVLDSSLKVVEYLWIAFMS